MNSGLTDPPIVGTEIVLDTENPTSSAGGMISYRFQRHSWITADGRLHIMVRMNNNPLPLDNEALFLYSSNDIHSGRIVYKKQHALKYTGARIYGGVEIKSSNDAILDGNTLYLVYNTFTGEVGLAIFEYVNSVSPYWNKIVERTVYSNRPEFVFRATKPSIAKDSTGRIWVGFMVCNFTDPDNVAYESKVYYAEEASGYTNWVDSHFDKHVDLDPIDDDPDNPQRSVRLLNYSTNIYAIVSDRITFYHTFIDGPPSGTNNWASKKLIYTIPEPGSEMQDPNRAHFSAVVRLHGNMPYIHFVTNNGDNDDAQIVYASYPNDDQPIETDNVTASGYTTLGHYPQISKYASDELYIVYDIEYSDGESNECRGLVILEENGVESDWVVKDQLVLPGTLPTCESGPARSIIPELIPDGNDIPVHQQVDVIEDPEEPDEFRLVIYEVSGPTP